MTATTRGGWLPRTRTGKWAAALAGALTLSLAIWIAATSTLGPDERATLDDLRITIPLFGAVAAALGAGVLGMIALVSLRDRAVAVVVATVMGTLVLLVAV